MRSCEILIVGAGPAGIAAALRASERSNRVTILDDNPAEGGQIWRGRQHGKLRESNVERITGCRVIAADAMRMAAQAETFTGAFEIQFEKLILATGARELFLPFPGWTLPNAMGVGGLQALVKSGLPVQGKRVVVAGSGPLLLAVASYLRKRGATVPLIAEQAGWNRLARFGLGLLTHPDKIRQAVGFASLNYQPNSWVEAAEGNGKLESVRVRHGNRTRQIACDYLANAYGYWPNDELAQHLGCGQVNELQQTSIENIYCAGEITGIGGADLSWIEGQIAGLAATGRSDEAKRLFSRRAKARRFARSLNTAFALRRELLQLADAQTIVCRCEDVTLGRLKSAGSWRAAKLHLRCGMGPCQGRVCGPAVHFLFGWSAESVRAPIFPARISSLISQEKGETK